MTSIIIWIISKVIFKMNILILLDTMVATSLHRMDGWKLGQFVSPPGVATLAAFSILDEAVSGARGLGARLGRGTKSPQNPLFGQDRAWEPRIDNGYANVVYDTTNGDHPWRMW